MKSIYRKLKDYIYKGNRATAVIFGDLMSEECCFAYLNENDEYCEWSCLGNYENQMDFLLNYYVVGIFPSLKLQGETVVPYLQICLQKEKPEL